MQTFVIIFYSIFGAFLIWGIIESVRARRSEPERFARANSFWLHLSHPDYENEDIENSEEDIKEEPEINQEDIEKQNLAIDSLIKLGIKKSRAKESIERVIEKYGSDLILEDMIKKSFQI